MPNERDFDKFAADLLATMGLARSPGTPSRGRGYAGDRLARSYALSQNGGEHDETYSQRFQHGERDTTTRNAFGRGQPGPSTSRVGATASEYGRQPGSELEGATGPPDLQTLREEVAAMGEQSGHESSVPLDSREDPPIPAGQSSVREGNPPAPVVNAIQRLVTDGNMEAVAQLFASLLTGQQQVRAPAAQAVTGPPAFHVIPDLSGNIEDFTGEADEIQAREWLESLETTKELHHWTDDYLLTAARSHLRAGARDWSRARLSTLKNWTDFRKAFQDTFITRENKSTRWARMQARRQGKGESLTTYFHAKVRLCSALGLSVQDQKEEILSGLRSRELFQTVLPGRHEDLDALLHSIVTYDRCLRSQDNARGNRDSGSSRNRGAGSGRTSSPKRGRSDRPSGETRADRSDSAKTRESVKCYNCNKKGHYARDCPEDPRPRKCKKCKKFGHATDQCSESANRPVQALSRSNDATVRKYLKDAIVHGKTMSAFIDPGSAECTMRASVVVRERLDTEPSTLSLRPFGPPENSVSSLGTVTADITVDGVSVPRLAIQVVPDDYQAIDLLIGRPFTDNEAVEYHKIGNNLTFCYAGVAVGECEPPAARMCASEAVAVPPHSVCFVSVCDNDARYAVPVTNTSDSQRLVKKNWPSVRGEVSTVYAIDRRNLDPSDIKVEDIYVGDGQSQQVREELCALLREFRDCVSTGLWDLGRATGVEMPIKVKEGATPVSRKPYRTSIGERETIRTIIAEWRQAGIVTDTQSPYASPVLLVKKKNGESRLCVDFRQLNAVTERVHFPLPNIDDHLAQIRDSELFIVLDLAHGYLQIPLAADAREKTAIITPEDTVEFTRMVFGLMNGPAFFSKAMQQALGPLRDTVALFYLDDILIPGKSWTDLKSKLRLVLEALRKAGFTIKLAKCRFLFGKVAYLGHEISANGIEPGTEKVGAIRDFPAPKNVHEIRRFLGLTSYFRKFVPRFAHIAQPLSRLLKTGAVFDWGEAQVKAFETLKQKLTEHPVLQTFNAQAHTELHTDASAAGLAGMLLQKDAGNNMRLVYAVSRRTTEPETRYHSSKLELLAIVWAVTRLRAMLANIEFTVVTDCQALCYLNTQKSLNPQMIRWNDLLSEYNFKIVHRPGVRLAHVDAMSRAPVETFEKEGPIGVFALQSEEDLVQMHQSSDERIRVKKEILAKPADQRTRDERGHVKGYELHDGVVYKRNGDRLLFVVPNTMRKSLVIKFHDLKSHQGAERVLSRILEHYYFPGIRAYVKKHIAACLDCTVGKSKPGSQPGTLHPIPPGRRPFAVINIDHLGPFVTSARGNKYVLAIVDNLSKFATIRAVKDTKAASVIRVLNEFVTEHGAPERIISDRGTCFTSGAFEQFCKTHGIKHTMNSPRHPQANGQVERLNATLVPAIRANLQDEEGKSWDKSIRKIQSDLNEMQNASTGKSPFEVVYGYVPQRDEGELRRRTMEHVTSYRAPEAVQDEARQNIERAQQRMKTRYDAGRARNVFFSEGDIVFMKTIPQATGESTKLSPKYRGPLVITQRLPSDTYKVADLTSHNGRRYATTAHASQLKLWQPHQTDSTSEEDDDGGAEGEDDNEAAINSSECKRKTLVNEVGKETDGTNGGTVRVSTRAKCRPKRLSDYVV